MRTTRIMEQMREYLPTHNPSTTVYDGANQLNDTRSEEHSQ